MIFALVFLKYLKCLRVASINLSQGKTALFEALLTGIFVAWLFPWLAWTTERRHSALVALAASLKELFRLRISLCSAAVVLAGRRRLAHDRLSAGARRRPFAGIVAALLFVLASGLIGLAVSHLISIAFWRRVLVTVAVVLLGALGPYVSRVPEMKGLRQLSTILPSALVARAAVGQQSWIAIVILAALCVAAYHAALWSFRLSLENTASRSSERSTTFAPFSFPGKLGGLMAKDFRYFRRLLDVYLGVLAAAAGCFYVVTAEAPSRGIFLALISIVFLLGTAVPFNIFGLDTRSGLDRYSLLPLRGTSIILSKNLAYLMIMSGQVLPLIFLAGWRLGISASACGLVEAAAHACAYLAWGNWMSVSHPLKMHFFRFASSGAALADALAGVVFGSLPGILIIYFLHTQGDRAAWEIVGVGLLFAALYYASLARFGSRFEQKRETIARALS